MTCEKCGTENPQGTFFCGNCGTAFGESRAEVRTELELETEYSDAETELELETEYSDAETELELETEYSEDEFLVRPSQWAWGIYAVPLVVIYALLMSVDVFTFGLLPVAVLAAFIVPRYITWRGSAYIFTTDSLVIKRGQLGREDRVPVLFTDIESFEERQGFLGPTLQYTSVHIFLNDGRQGVLSYVPVNSGVIDRLLDEGIAEGVVPEDDPGDGEKFDAE